MVNELATTEDREIQAPQKNLPASAADTKRLDDMLARREMTKQDLQVLRGVIFPNAQTDNSIFLAIDYCKARKLDVMKRVVHIVPVWRDGEMVDTIWPGIAEHRITAHRTGVYAGHDPIEYGPEKTVTWEASKGKKGKETLVKVEVTFPEWGSMTVYKIVQGIKCPFPVKLRWLEAYKTLAWNSKCPNDRWEKAPYGQFDKCIEAAALRAAFPEECSEPTAEEMEGTIESSDEGGAVTVRAIKNTIAEKAQEIADAAVDAEIETPPEPTAQEQLKAAAEVAKQLGHEKAAESLAKSANAGITPKQAMELMNAGKPNGWTIAKILEELKAQYNLDGKTWQKQMTERQWREMCDFVATSTPGE